MEQLGELLNVCSLFTQLEELIDFRDGSVCARACMCVHVYVHKPCGFFPCAKAWVGESLRGPGAGLSAGLSGGQRIGVESCGHGVHACELTHTPSPLPHPVPQRCLHLGPTPFNEHCCIQSLSII